MSDFIRYQQLPNMLIDKGLAIVGQYIFGDAESTDDGLSDEVRNRRAGGSLQRNGFNLLCE